MKNGGAKKRAYCHTKNHELGKSCYVKFWVILLCYRIVWKQILNSSYGTLKYDDNRENKCLTMFDPQNSSTFLQNQKTVWSRLVKDMSWTSRVAKALQYF